MSNDTEGDDHDRGAPRWIALALAVLLVEVAALTPFVEVQSGPLHLVMSGKLCSAVLFGVAALLILRAARRGRNGDAKPNVRRTRTAPWVAANIALYSVFVSATLTLADSPPGGSSSMAVPALWLALAGMVGLSAAAIAFPPRLLLALAVRRRGTLAAAVALAAASAVVAPAARGLWPSLHGPSTALVRALLALTFGEGLSGYGDDGSPVVGTPGLLLLVTPGCSELDAVALFWLLGASALVAAGPGYRRAPILLALALGTPALYLVNALRIYALVAIGLRTSPGVAVALAHSRISSALFLAASTTTLILALRLGRPAPDAPGPIAGAGGSSSLPPDDEARDLSGN